MGAFPKQVLPVWWIHHAESRNGRFREGSQYHGPGCGSGAKRRTPSVQARAQGERASTRRQGRRLSRGDQVTYPAWTNRSTRSGTPRPARRDAGVRHDERSFAGEWAPDTGTGRDRGERLTRHGLTGRERFAGGEPLGVEGGAGR